MSEFVHQRQLRPALQQAVQIHLGQNMPLMLDDPAGQDLQAARQGLRFGAAMRFDHRGDDVDAFLQPRLGGFQHGVGLADTRRHAEEDAQLASTRAASTGQERVRVGAARLVRLGQGSPA